MSAVRVLLWSPAGAGLHYHGPGMAAYRLYKEALPDECQVDLAHGAAVQSTHEAVFRARHMIHPITSGVIDQVRFVLASRGWLRHHVRHYDVFHGLGGYEITVRPAWWAQTAGLPSVVKITNAMLNLCDRGGWKSVLGIARRRRRLLSGLSAVIATSRDIGNELAGYGVPEDRIVTIPNGVDTKEFRPCGTNAERLELRRRLGWPPAAPILLFVGVLTRRKQPHVLIDALAKLPGVCLVLAGPRKDSSYFAELQPRARASGVYDRVIWVDFTPHTPPLYRAADIFALPSSNEGMSNALLEAMSCGLAVVSSPVSGSKDLIVDGMNGRLVIADPGLMADAIRSYVSNADYRNEHGRAARETIEEGYGTAAVFQQHLSLFRLLRAGATAK